MPAKLPSILTALFSCHGAATAVAPTYQSVIGGFYTDPNHYHPHTLEGIRLCGFPNNDADFAFTGSDDGTSFWRVSGKVLSGDVSKVESGEKIELMANFAEKGGPANFKGTYSKAGGEAGVITWQDGNNWEQQKKAELSFGGGGGSSESGGSGFWQGMASGLGVALLLAVIGFLYLSANKPQGPRDASDWSPAPE